jgi:ankyrin repeat protein
MANTRIVVAAIGILLLNVIPAWCAEIHDAAEKGEVYRVESLLRDKPRRINARNENGETPLRRAAYEGQKAVVEILIQLRYMEELHEQSRSCGSS